LVGWWVGGWESGGVRDFSVGWEGEVDIPLKLRDLGGSIFGDG